MKITYDPQADAVYIQFNTDQIDSTREIFDNQFGDILVDLDANGSVCGIEILSASHYITDLDRVDYQLLTRAPEDEVEHTRPE